MPLPRFLLPVALLTLAGSAQAQTTPPDSARVPKHQVGLTASPQLARFFTANRSLPVGLIYKQQVKPNQFLRLRLVGFYNRSETANANPYFTPATKSIGPNTSTWEVNAFVGYEWQHALSRRFKWGYGAEVGGGYHHQQTEFSLQEILGYTDSPNLYVVTTNGSPFLHRWMMQGRGFTNFSYAFSSRLTLFAETAIIASYESQKQGGDASQTFSDGQPPRYGTRYPDITQSSLRLDFHPIQLIGLTVSF